MRKFVSFKPKQLGVFIIIALIAGVIIFFATRTTSAASRNITEQVTTGSIAKTVSVSGNVEAARTQEGTFAASSSSKVTGVYVKPGDKVKTGQALAQIDDTELQAKLVQAGSQMNQAKNNLSNTYTQGRYTTYDIENLKENIRSAEANYATAKANLESAVLRAEFDGEVVSVSLQVGNTGGTNSIVVMDPNSFYLDVSLTEYDLAKLQKDMNANVTFDSLDGKSYLGKLSEVNASPDIQSNVVSYPAKIALTVNDGKLKLGYSGKATITLESKENVLVVSSAAVKSRPTGKYVIVIENGQQVEKTVETGLVGDTQTEITSGLTENETVLVSVVQTGTASTTNTNQMTAIPGGAVQFNNGGGNTFRFSGRN